MRFRPSPIPTVLVAVGLAILLRLGVWQLTRDKEDNTFVASLNDRVQAQPLGNADMSRPPEELAWHRAMLAGHFTEQAPILLTGYFASGEMGYGVVQVFALDGGPSILVDRGWIPRDGWQQALTSVNAGTAPMTVHGLLQTVAEDAGQHPTRAVLGPLYRWIGIDMGDSENPIPGDENAPERWSMHQYPAIAKHVGGVLGVRLVAGDPVDATKAPRFDVLPVAQWNAEPEVRPHLQYAATWFGIGAILLVTWVFAGVQRGARLSGGAK